MQKIIIFVLLAGKNIKTFFKTQLRLVFIVMLTFITLLGFLRIDFIKFYYISNLTQDEHFASENSEENSSCFRDILLENKTKKNY